MKQEKLVELYDLLKNNIVIDGKVPSEVIEKLQSLSDSQIDTIINSPQYYYMYRLLTDNAFYQNYSPEMQNKVIEIMNKTNPLPGFSNSVFETVYALMNEDYTQTDDYRLKVLNLISTAKGEEQSEDALRMLTTSYRTSINDVTHLKMIELMAYNDDHKITALVMSYIDDLPTKYRDLDAMQDIITSLATAKGYTQASLGSEVANFQTKAIINDQADNAYRNLDVKRIAKSVSLVTTEENSIIAKLLKDILTDDELVKKETACTYASIIKRAKGEKQAIAAHDIVLSKVLSHAKSEDAISAIKAICQTPNNFNQAEYIASVLLKKGCLSRAAYGRIDEIIESAKSETHFKLAINLLLDGTLADNPRFNEIVSTFLYEAKEDYQVDYAYKIATNPFLKRALKLDWERTGAHYLTSAGYLLDLVREASNIQKAGDKVSIDKKLISYLTETLYNSPEEIEVSMFDLFEVYDNFWCVFASNPNEAMNLLRETHPDGDFDVTYCTKIRIRKQETSSQNKTATESEEK